MIGFLLTMAGTIGLVYYADKSMKEKNPLKSLESVPGTAPETINKQLNEEEEVKLIRNRYIEPYTKFSIVKNYFENSFYRISEDMLLSEVLEQINKYYLAEGQLPMKKEDREPIIKYYELLLNQKIVWNRLEEVTKLYNKDSIETEIVESMVKIIEEQYNEFIELEKTSKKEREELALNLLGNLQYEEEFESLYKDSKPSGDLENTNINLKNLLEKDN